MTTEDLKDEPLG